jgi:hypothetical protein
VIWDSQGRNLSWCNGRTGGDFKRERLDRAVATMGWNELFDVVEVFVLARS